MMSQRHTIPIPIYVLSDQERETLKDFSGAAVLQVTVCNARFQPRDGSTNTTFDTFVACSVNGREEKETDVKVGTRSPGWGDEFQFEWASDNTPST